MPSYMLMSYGLNSLNWGYMWDYIGEHCKGDTRSLDCSSYGPNDGNYSTWEILCGARLPISTVGLWDGLFHRLWETCLGHCMGWENPWCAACS